MNKMEFQFNHVNTTRRHFLKHALVTTCGSVMYPTTGLTAGFLNRTTLTTHFNDYEFIPPQNWQVISKPDHLLLTQTPDQQGCIILIFPPQPLAGSLDLVAKSVFETMYRGWAYAKSGEQQYRLLKGFLPIGHEYYMIEADMNATGTDGRYYLEDGAALVVRANNQIAIIAVRHRGLLAHIDCINKYETWRRFFNSFRFKFVTNDSNHNSNAAPRIIGAWSQSGGRSISEYTFAANGRYSFGGALGSSFTQTNGDSEQLYLRTNSFTGDGKYTINNDKLTLVKNNYKMSESLIFRFEQVNHAGMGWKDRLYLRSRDQYGEIEVCYEKK